MSVWRDMSSAPKGREILVRRHNDCFYEHYVVWWTKDPEYPWESCSGAFPEDRLDEWMEIPE